MPDLAQHFPDSKETVSEVQPWSLIVRGSYDQACSPELKSRAPVTGGTARVRRRPRRVLRHW
eukprot:1189244-Pleurochrysis_carterae.AAC.3